jgi:hypothetical protein
LVELCLHIANLLYLMSFLGRDMLWLRVLTCAGLTLGIVFFSCQPTPLYGPMAWHVVFLAINGVQIWRVVLERRELMLTEEQEMVAAATFREFSRDELVTLLTRLASRKPARLRDIPQVCQEQLTVDERALRDIAFSRLSRPELMNLVTRRLWNALRQRWRRRRSSDLPAEPAGRKGTQLIIKE